MYSDASHLRRRETLLIRRVQHLIAAIRAQQLEGPRRTDAIARVLRHEEELVAVRERMERLRAIDERIPVVTLLARQASHRRGPREHRHCDGVACANGVPRLALQRPALPRPALPRPALPRPLHLAAIIASYCATVERYRLSTESVIERARVGSERTKELIAQSLQRLSR